jgi:hypothetical protein
LRFSEIRFYRSPWRTTGEFSSLFIALQELILLLRHTKAFRLKAWSKILDQQSLSHPRLRGSPAALTLTAFCRHRINALHQRGDDRIASRELLKVCLPNRSVDDVDELSLPCRVPIPRRLRRTHTVRDADNFELWMDADSDDDEHSGTMVPYVPYGMIFPGSLSLFSCPTVGKPLHSNYLLMLLNRPIDEIQDRLITNVVSDVDMLSSGMTSNKMRNTREIESSSEMTEPLFRLEHLGITIDTGSSREGDLSDFVSSNELLSWENCGVDELVTKLWLQAMADVASKAPNQHGNRVKSYLKLTSDERLAIGEDLFKTRCMSDYWTRVRWEPAGRDDWENAFNLLFPDINFEIPQSAQNWTQCIYFRRWRRIVASNHYDIVDAIRKALRDRFNTLTYFPKVSRDRMWNTSARRPSIAMPATPPRPGKPDDLGLPGPRLLFRGGITPIWQSAVDNAVVNLVTVCRQERAPSRWWEEVEDENSNLE